MLPLLLTAILAAASPIAPRLEAVSEAYLGRPYVADPLGEGPESRFDRDPLTRTDGFDCTTFIETVIAAARSCNEETYRTQMNLIRYRDGVVDFWSRNHFTEVDWAPSGIRHGFFRDVTEAVAGAAVQYAETLINRPGWAA